MKKTSLISSVVMLAARIPVTSFIFDKHIINWDICHSTMNLTICTCIYVPVYTYLYICTCICAPVYICRHRGHLMWICHDTILLTICTCMSVGNGTVVDLWYQPNISKIAELAVTLWTGDARCKCWSQITTQHFTRVRGDCRNVNIFRSASLHGLSWIPCIKLKLFTIIVKNISFYFFRCILSIDWKMNL